MAIRKLPMEGILILVVITVCLVLATLAVAGRVYARVIKRKPISLDDWFIIAGLVFGAATVGSEYFLVLQGGAGLHEKDATRDQVIMTAKLLVIMPMLWGVSVCFIKLSILCFYIDIFTIQLLRKGVYLVIGLTVCMMLAIVMQSFLLCRPFAAMWDKTIPGGVCGNFNQAYLSISILNLITDLAIILLPMPVLWSLNLAFKKKMGISIILGLGLIVCGLTAARIDSVVKLDLTDSTYTVVGILLFGALEIELGIVCACIPMLRPLFQKAFGQNSIFATDSSAYPSKASSASWSHSKTISSSRSVRKRQDSLLLDDAAEMSGVSVEVEGARRGMEVDLESGRSPSRAFSVTVTRDVYVSREDSPSAGTAR